MKIRFWKPTPDRFIDVVIFNFIEARVTEVKVRRRFRVIEMYMRLELFGFAGVGYVANYLSYEDNWGKTDKESVFVSRTFPTLEVALGDWQFSHMIGRAA
jgi:hypothetical protein